MATPTPIDVHHRTDGQPGAPVLVLSHALGLSLAMWDPQVPRLSQQLRLLRYDHRGHGGSPVPTGPYTIEHLGRDLLHLLDRLGLERVSFCGLSLGGMVGLWLGANAPERIDRLVVCCSAARMPRPDDYAARVANCRRNPLDLVIIGGSPVSEGIDPAVLSAPLIATLVDATGLVIYFTIAKAILHL